MDAAKRLDLNSSAFSVLKVAIFGILDILACTGENLPIQLYTGLRDLKMEVNR